ncbi:MAG: acetylglutamate kinase, partial [Bacteroidales bacterium]|nr:acetylglutamate kinase [Bacteroidales bacterium]
MKSLTVIKIGGNIIDRPEELDSFLMNFIKIDGPKILIHGGGVMASEMATKLGIKTVMHQGRRITDLETLKLVSMVYAGWINKSIIAKLQKLGCNSIGLSGADGDSVPAVKRSPVPIDFGYVGDVD